MIKLYLINLFSLIQ